MTESLHPSFSEEEVYAAELARMVRQSIDSQMTLSERSQWSEGHRIGVSDIGGCREYVRRLIDGVPFSDLQNDFHSAFVGTAIGDLAERAVQMYGGERVVGTQLSVTVSLRIGGEGEAYLLNIPGHPDLLLTDGVADFKSKDGLGAIRSSGPSLANKFQVSLYAKALIDDGRMDPDGWVSLVFIDRAGNEPDPYVVSWRYDPAITQQAEEWLADVIYAVQRREEASKDMPRTWCFECCPYASDCRGSDTDTEGLLDDPIVLDAIKVYREALEAGNAAEKDKRSAKSVLEHYSGMTPNGWNLRWINVGEVEVPASTRRAHRKISLTPIKTKRAK